MPEMNITHLVSRYIAARDLKAKIVAKHKAKLEPLDAAMDKTELAILDFFQKHGMDSAKCEAGTAYRSTKGSATVADMDAFLDFVRKNDAWHMLERRVSKVAVEEYVDQTKDLPPGVTYSRIATIGVRRAS